MRDAQGDAPGLRPGRVEDPADFVRLLVELGVCGSSDCAEDAGEAGAAAGPAMKTPGRKATRALVKPEEARLSGW